MRDFILEFEGLAERLCWYLLGAFEFVADEFIAFCLVLGILIEELLRFIFCQIFILKS